MEQFFNKIYLYNHEKDIISREYSPGTIANQGHTSKVTCTKFVPWSSNVFISSGWDGTLFFWDSRDKKPLQEFFGYKMNYELIDCLKNKTILLGLNNGENPIGIYDFHNMKLLENIKIGKYPNCSSIMFSKSNNFLMSTSMAYKRINILEKGVENYETIWSINGFEKEVFSSDLSLDNKTLTTVNGNNIYSFSLDNLI